MRRTQREGQHPLKSEVLIRNCVLDLVAPKQPFWNCPHEFSQELFGALDANELRECDVGCDPVVPEYRARKGLGGVHRCLKLVEFLFRLDRVTDPGVGRKASQGPVPHSERFNAGHCLVQLSPLLLGERSQQWLAQADMGLAVCIRCGVVGASERVHWLDHAGRGEDVQGTVAVLELPLLPVRRVSRIPDHRMTPPFVILVATVRWRVAVPDRALGSPRDALRERRQTMGR